MNPTFITGLNGPINIVLSGNNLFVSNWSGGTAGAGTVGEYNATTGAPINLNFITGLSGPEGLTLSGNSLLVVNSRSTARLAHTERDHRDTCDPPPPNSIRVDQPERYRHLRCRPHRGGVLAGWTNGTWNGKALGKRCGGHTQAGGDPDEQ